MVSDARLTAREASKLIQTGELTSVDLTSRLIEQARATEHTLHAYTCLAADEALESAARADAEVAGGRVRSPLHGIPFGVKDVLLTAGMPTEAGSRLLEGFVPDADAEVVRRLREAGAVLLGKLETQEFAAGQNVPNTRCAWNTSHWPGGSSAGSGVSVAVGSATFALGSDAGGSIRLPAALNSIVGLKPTYGRVSRRGVVPAGTSTLDCVGPMTLTADDAALVLEVIAGYDPSDPGSADAPDFRAIDPDRFGLSGARLGVERSFFFGETLDDAVKPVAEQALGAFERLGASLIDIDLPALRLVNASSWTIFVAETAAAHRTWLLEQRSGYGAGTRRFLQMGSLLPDGVVGAARRARRRLIDEMRSIFAAHDLDALLVPTSPLPFIGLEELDGAEIMLSAATDVGQIAPYMFFANLTGQPAISMPSGFTADGDPVGIQIVGRPFDEATILSIARAYEGDTQWYRTEPPLASSARSL